MIRLFCISVLFGFLIQSCEATPEEKYASFFPTEQDSLIVVEEILDSMRVELDSFLSKINSDTTFASPPNMSLSRRNFLRFYVDSNKITSSNNPSLNITNGEVKKMVFDFYRQNASKNDISNDFPMYATLTDSLIRIELRRVQGFLDSSQKMNKEFIEIRKNQLEEWKNRRKLLSILNVDTLREINPQAHLTIIDKLPLGKNKFIVDEILMSYLEMRDSISFQYFGESYSRLFYRNKSKPTINDSNYLFAIKSILPIKLFVYSRINPKSHHYWYLGVSSPERIIIDPK